MPVVRAAAAAEHIDLREAAQQFGVLPTELYRIAGVELGANCRVRHGCLREALARMPRRRCIQARPRPTTWLEMRRVRAVDHVIGRRPPLRVSTVSIASRQALAGRQPAVGLDREGDHARHARGLAPRARCRPLR